MTNHVANTPAYRDVSSTLTDEGRQSRLPPHDALLMAFGAVLMCVGSSFDLRRFRTVRVAWLR